MPLAYFGDEPDQWFITGAFEMKVFFSDAPASGRKQNCQKAYNLMGFAPTLNTDFSPLSAYETFWAK